MMRLGNSDLRVGPVAYGCWRFTQSTTAQADRKIRTAIDNGLTLIDTADIYGIGEVSPGGHDGFGAAEAVLGDVLAGSPDLRAQMVLATKGGIDAVRPYDSTYDYLTAAIDASLTRLQTDYVDLYQIHRPDLTTPMAETARALNDMVQAGKVRYVGVSNFTPAQTRALSAHLDAPLMTTQPEFSAMHQDPITDGTLDLCMEMGMSALAWSPLAGGALATGKGANVDVITVIDRIAARENTDRSTVALAFTMGHGADVIPIIGTQNLDRIKQAAKASTMPLSARDWYDIVEAYRGEGMP
ncbi:aldo/keto reductase family oxidoreductase [Fretibacter rubidus]|uniref:aldo/keto reductase n=1 Tax=Fretibacter rubidus TaxID=570162 RepID=UPI00352A8477